MKKTLLPILVLAGACSSSEPTDPDIVGDPLAAALSHSMSGLAVLSPDLDVLGYGLTQPSSARPRGEVNQASCDAAELAVNEACAVVAQPDGHTSCWGQTTFFYAHDMPRCAGRIELYDASRPDAITPMLTFDLTGESRVGGDSDCGNGVLDDGEQCDDGNHEAWDGCDPNCMPEQFNGCEAVIEEKFQAAHVAFVDRDLWASPRSHLMVHGAVDALAPVDSGLCATARTVAQDACAQLTADMPFVSWCTPSTEFGSDVQGAFCAVRLTVGFWQLQPLSGIFTTSLPGLLSFTIR